MHLGWAPCWRVRQCWLSLSSRTKADIHAANKLGICCLHWAAWGGSLEAVAFLLDKHADINAVTWRWMWDFRHFNAFHPDGNWRTPKLLEVQQFLNDNWSQGLPCWMQCRRLGSYGRLFWHVSVAAWETCRFCIDQQDTWQNLPQVSKKTFERRSMRQEFIQIGDWSDDWCTIVIEIWFTSICCSPYYSVTKNLYSSDNWHTFRQVIFEVPFSNSPLLSTLRNGHGVLNKVAWRGMDLGLYLERWSEAQLRINCRWLKPPKKIKRSYSIYIFW